MIARLVRSFGRAPIQSSCATSFRLHSPARTDSVPGATGGLIEAARARSRSLYATHAYARGSSDRSVDFSTDADRESASVSEESQAPSRAPDFVYDAEADTIPRRLMHRRELTRRARRRVSSRLAVPIASNL